jgi:hypothetical protein
MSNIGGKKREVNLRDSADYPKKVGLFEAKVIAVNPTIEEYKTLFDIELKDDSKATEYLGESRDGNKTLRLDFWLEEIKSKERFKLTFFLEDKIKDNKDGTKKQYINNVGVCSWAVDPNDLLDWFVKRDYRVAFVGEEELYEFMRTWLGNLDYRDAETTLQLEWKKLMNGNIRDIKAQIDGEWATNVVALATIVTREKDGETKEYQGVYNRMFLPAYSLKQFRVVDYTVNKNLSVVLRKQQRELKGLHEKFIHKVAGEYGCKDFYVLKELAEYKSEDNLVASDVVISDDGPDL